MEYEREARSVDYSRKRGLLHEEFSAPRRAPKWLRDLVAENSVAGASEAFWNKVEAFEKRSDAQLAKDLTIALPLELTARQNIQLVREFVEHFILAKGMVADWVFHDAPGNPHVHLMTTLRPLTEDGFGSKKVAVVGANGEKLRTTTGKTVYEQWAGGVEDFVALRMAWFDTQNRHLALYGLDIRVDGRSHAERGLEISPTSHVGVAAAAIQRKSVAAASKVALDRVDLFEKRRKEGVAQILRRPDLVLEMISAERSVFDDRDIARVLHRYVDDPAVFQQLMSRILESPETLRIESEGVDVATGAKIRARYTTRNLILLEAAMSKRAAWLSERSTHRVGTKVVETVLSRHAMLSDEQCAAIEHVTSEGAISAIIGRAGAGKTTMLRGAREAWELAGYRVAGAALAGKAAEELEKEAGIASLTLASWERRWQQGRGAIDERTVFVLDEAGMVAWQTMAFVIEAVVKSGAKLVLVGDPEQLQPIEAGAAFRLIANHIGYAELGTIYRQRHAWMRSASLDLARGRIAEALDAYARKGSIRASAVKAQAIDNLVADWDREYDPDKSTLILAHLRRDVRLLNQLVREKLVKRGIVGEGHQFRTDDGIRQFDVGDCVVFLKNEASLGVRNGMFGHVLKAAQNRVQVAIGDGEDRRIVKVEQRFYGHLDHGYATTIHKSQGSTVDRVMVLASLSLDRHLTYVAMTRHREDLAFYYGRQSFAKSGGLEHVLSRANAKETTLDYAQGKLYRAALSFAENRGFHLVRVARTLLRDSLQKTLSLKPRFVGVALRLRGIAARMGLCGEFPLHAKAEPLIQGVVVFSRTLADVVETRIRADKALKSAWANLLSRFGMVFADTGAVLTNMNFHAMLTNPAACQPILEKLVRQPQAVGTLNGREGLMASTWEKTARNTAMMNIAPLRRDIERYLAQRRKAAERIEHEETARRQRQSIPIPALSPVALSMLEKAREALDHEGAALALGQLRKVPELKREIDGFVQAIAERFGGRALFDLAAGDPPRAIDAETDELRGEEREKLRQALPLVRAAQQIAAHERQLNASEQLEKLTLSERREAGWRM